MSARWVPVGRVDELVFDPGAAVAVEDRRIAVFPVAGGWRALDNACPHASAPLCEGYLETARGRVVCALHLWEFDLDTGACDVGPEWNVRTYPVREVGGVLEIDLGGP